MTTTEKIATLEAQIAELKKTNDYLAKEFVKLENKFMVASSREITLLGKAKEEGLSLTEIEATVNVLKHYKELGFKSITL